MNDTNKLTFETSEPKTSFSEPQKILGWHFSRNTKLRFDDNRPIVVGETLSVEGDIIPCEFGLHASKNALDAFQYIHVNYLWRVELEGDLKSHGRPIDKWVGRRRKVLAGGDATEMLLKFARECVLDVIHLWSETPREEVKTFLETGVITDFVTNYFDYINANAAASYAAFYAYYAAFYTYYACKTDYEFKAYYVYKAIYNAAGALNVDIETYTNKFEKACLNFIEEKS